MKIVSTAVLGLIVCAANACAEKGDNIELAIQSQSRLCEVTCNAVKDMESVNHISGVIDERGGMISLQSKGKFWGKEWIRLSAVRDTRPQAGPANMINYSMYYAAMDYVLYFSIPHIIGRNMRFTGYIKAVGDSWERSGEKSPVDCLIRPKVK